MVTNSMEVFCELIIKMIINDRSCSVMQRERYVTVIFNIEARPRGIIRRLHAHTVISMHIRTLCLRKLCCLIIYISASNGGTM